MVDDRDFQLVAAFRRAVAECPDNQPILNVIRLLRMVADGVLVRRGAPDSADREMARDTCEALEI